MKIKLIIILFGISCLIFPAGLMEADAIPFLGPIAKGIGKNIPDLIPKGPAVEAGKLIIITQDFPDLCSSIKSEARHQKICNEDDQVEFNQVNYEQYGFTVQTPTNWQPYDVTSTMFDPGDSSEFHQFVSIWFSNDPDIWNTDEAGFLLQMIDYLVKEHGLSREKAYILCSVAVDLRVGQVVDVPNYVVTAVLNLDVFDKHRH